MALAIGSGSLFSQYFYVNPPDSVRYLSPNRDEFVIGGDTVHFQFIADAERATARRSQTLTERDYIEVAAELGVEVAAIKAVVEIEAGKAHKGFWKPGHPIINFDLSVFRQMASRHKINLSAAQSKHPVVFNRPNISKYGSQQAAVQARVDGAMAIDSVTAIEGTFWGMFQIGGFNWRQCGTSGPKDFWRKMCTSERDQLELFAEFITRAGLLPHLKSKNWSAFARGYNGPSYAKRGYHTRLAAAYARYNK